MYNRYIPAEDGTYRRQVVGNRQSTPVPPPKTSPPVPVKAPEPPSPPVATSLFLGLDTADLLILLILILVMMDEGRDNTTLLLTVALYFLLQ